MEMHPDLEAVLYRMTCWLAKSGRDCETKLLRSVELCNLSSVSRASPIGAETVAETCQRVGSQE